VVVRLIIGRFQAAVFGAGCWAERLTDGRSIACSVSGQGELIMQSSMAKTLAERVAAAEGDDTHEVLRSVLLDHFYCALPPSTLFDTSPL
jgi:taspase (threonine aspartase 1)